MSKALKVFLGLILIATIGFWAWFFFGSSGYAACKDGYWQNAIVPIPGEATLSAQIEIVPYGGGGCGPTALVAGYTVHGGHRVTISKKDNSESVAAIFYVFDQRNARDLKWATYVGLFSRSGNEPMKFESAIQISDKGADYLIEVNDSNHITVTTPSYSNNPLTVQLELRGTNFVKVSK